MREHYPLETDVLAEELGPFDAVILIPYFEAGGRYTVHDTHYVAEGDTLVRRRKLLSLATRLSVTAATISQPMSKRKPTNA